MEKDKKNFSFTLIELLITIFIIFILSGISIAYYNNFTEEQKLKNEVKKLVDLLELAKKKTAASDYLNAQCSGYGYKIEINSNDYQLKVCCNTACNSDQSIITFNLPDNIQFQSTDSVRFLPLTVKIESTSNSFLIKNQSMGKCVTVEISQFGIINLNESLTSC